MHNDPAGAGTTSGDQPRVILVGNPNVGKSAIFGALTGKYVVVSNYPGTTVEVSRGSAVLNKKKTPIIDTPGANSLVPMSEDERVTRDILLEDNPSVIVQVADAKNLSRAFVVSSQLADMELPFVLALNMADEARSRGIKTNIEALQNSLGVPVISTIATHRKGIDKLIAAIPAGNHSGFHVLFDRRIEKAVAEIEGLLSSVKRGKRAIALTILSEDESIAPWLHERLHEETIRKIESIRADLQSKYMQSLGYVINVQRLRAAERLLSKVQETDHRAAQNAKQSSYLKRIHPLAALPLFVAVLVGLHLLTAINPIYAVLSLPILILALYIFGDWGMHPTYGVPILCVVLYLTWLFVGSFGAGTMVDFLEENLFGKAINPAAIWLADHVLPWSFGKDLLVGEYGLVTMALTYALAIVLPIVGTFFIAFGLLEDSGYLPRLAVMVDKVFKAMGLNGKAVLPMVLGLGCDTMATLTARILDTRRERIIVTLLLALGVPCSAQLGVTMGILSMPGMPLTAMLIWLGVVLFVLFKVGFLAGKLMPGTRTDFILEVPPTRVPQMENIVIKTLARAEWYLKEAVPLFVIGTSVLFTTDRVGLLQMVQKVSAPFVQGFLGLPAKATEAFIVGFLRRDYGVAGFKGMAEAGTVNTTQIVVGLITITLFIPCIANFLVIIKERGIKTALAIIAFVVPYAFLIGGIVNWVLRTTKIFD